MRNPFTLEDIKILTDFYGKIPTKDLAEILNRSVGVICHKAYKLKITVKGLSAIDRFMRNIFLSDKTYNNEPCWQWTGSKDSFGYGLIGINNKLHKAHRWIYKKRRGNIKSGLELDHLCGNASCVNPNHLEAVTHQMNMSRSIAASKALCKNGHVFDETNTYKDPEGRRSCRICRRINLKRHYTSRKLRGVI